MSKPRAKFVTTTVEVEGREETKIVEVPAFDPSPWEAGSELTIVGTRATRVDSPEKVAGRARYTADIQRPRMLFAAFARAAIARGKVTSLDLNAARAVPGVVDVIAGEEASAAFTSAPASRLFSRSISYFGQPIAAVCAESEHAARRGAEAVVAQYDAEPFVASFESAVAPDAPKVRSSGNVASGSPSISERGDVQRGLAEANVVIRRTFRTPVALHSALEPHGAVAEWDGDRVTVWESTQSVFRTRRTLAQALGMPLSHVRVIKDYMGGGFGAKNAAGYHTYTAALLARRLGRAVRCVVDRQGEQTDTGNRPCTVQRVTLGATRDGRLTAIELEAGIPLGVSGWEGGPAKIYHELYSCPNVRTSETFAYVNTPGMSAFRAPGHAEGAFGLERAMDELARELGMDPVDLRRRNFAEHDEEKNRPWSSNRLLECYDEAEKRFGWGSERALAPAGKRRGVGVAAQCWGTGGGPPAYAIVKVNGDGSADVLTGTQDLGTGARTVFAQVAAEAMGLELGRVRCVIGDTERTPYAPNSWGSMTTPSVAPAVRMAAEDARSQLIAAAAQVMKADEDELDIRNGIVRAADGREMKVSDVCRKLGEVMIIGRGSRGPNPDHTGIFTFGVQMAEVEVDPATGIVKVLRIVAAHDGGRILNPTLAESQLEGGIIQGLGYALFEERVLDESSGMTMNANLHDYKVPVMADIPEIDAFFVDNVDTVANHTGARGIAEPPIIPTAPAIANAVRDALGYEVNEIPLTPWRVLDPS
jgi:xanthine dehydrogenase YagR molybdenum-binding subunit